MKRLVIVALFSLFWVSLTIADTLSETVRANRTTVLGGVNLFNQRNCTHGGIPKLSLKQAPAHGKVTFKPNVVAISKGRCKGKKIRGSQIVYTPNRGYRGKDNFEFQFSYDKYVTGSTARAYVSQTVKLTVK